MLRLDTELTDAALLMFDKLMGSLSRRAERKAVDNAAKRRFCGRRLAAFFDVLRVVAGMALPFLCWLRLYRLMQPWPSPRTACAAERNRKPA